MVAVELLRSVTFWNNSDVGDFSLHYLRDKEKREVDFLIARKNRPFLIIEAREGDENIDENLLYFQKKLKVPAVQLVNKKDGFRRRTVNGRKVLVATASTRLASLP